MANLFTSRALSVRLARVGAALLLLIWAWSRFLGYNCMVPEWGNEPWLFLLASVAFSVGVVWIVTEVTAFALEQGGESAGRSVVLGLLLGVALYGLVAALMYKRDPLGHGDARVTLSLSWAAGYLQDSGHYSSESCGY